MRAAALALVLAAAGCGVVEDASEPTINCTAPTHTIRLPLIDVTPRAIAEIVVVVVQDCGNGDESRVIPTPTVSNGAMVLLCSDADICPPCDGTACPVRDMPTVHFVGVVD